MRLVGRLLGIMLVAAIAVVIAVLIFVQDANRLKPELETLLSEATGYTVTIGGDVSWQLWPPLTLTMADLTATDPEAEGEEIRAAAIDLKMDLSAMWEDIEKWRVSELTLNETTLTDATSETVLTELVLRDFRPNQPADLEADIVYKPVDGEPVNAAIAGTVTYFPPIDASSGRERQRERIAFADTKITSDLGDAVCDGELTTVDNPPALATALPADAILPIDTLWEYDVTATCAVSRLPLGTETFRDATVEVTNAGGALDALLEVNDFLDGALRTEIAIDTRARPVAWTIVPEITGVDSQRLVDWSEQNLQWIASIGAASSFTMRGNTEAELLRSIRGASEFDGGQGQLNINKIKAQLMRIALLAGEGERVTAWPDVWDYQNFKGRWSIDGTKQVLSFALDHMSVNAEGTFDYFTDEVDMLANVIVNEPADAASPFRINPLLMGTPIPIRCRGASTDPTCRLDQDAARQIVARALTSGDESGLRKKIEQKIDEEVPEEYRETARDLLDILGRSLDRN